MPGKDKSVQCYPDFVIQYLYYEPLSTHAQLSKLSLTDRPPFITLLQSMDACRTEGLHENTASRPSCFTASAALLLNIAIEWNEFG